MSIIRPDFLDSEFFIEDENGNWSLLPGAPEEVVKEFDEYMEQEKENIKLGRD